MNSCILMAKIIQDPELRYMPDNQVPIAQMIVEFPSLRAEDPASTLKVVGWGNFATEIKENYGAGDQILIEGRLRMSVVERPEGFKEKRAELTASRIHKVGSDLEFERPSESVTPATAQPVSSQRPENVVPLNRNRPAAPTTERSGRAKEYAAISDSEAEAETAISTPTTTTSTETEHDLDDIPFLQSVSLKTSAIDLQDPWEEEVNQPGIGLYGVRSLYW